MQNKTVMEKVIMTEFLQMYSNEIVTLFVGAITAVVTWIGGVIKKSLDKNQRSKEINEVINAVVGMAERQVPKLKGDEKFAFAVSKASEWLNCKGIQISDAELECQIELAVNSITKALSEDK